MVPPVPAAESSGSTVDRHTVTAGGDRLLATQLQLAHIEGMLSTVLQGYETRFAAVESAQAVHGNRLNDKSKVLARQAEQIETAARERAEIRARLAVIESDSKQRGTKILAAVGVVIAIIAGGLSLFNRLVLIDPSSIPLP